MVTPLKTTDKKASVPYRRPQPRRAAAPDPVAENGAIPSTGQDPENENGFSFRGATRAGEPLPKHLYINVTDAEQARAELAHSGVRVLDLTPRKTLTRKKKKLPSRIELAALAEQIGDQVEAGESLTSVCTMLGRNSNNQVVGHALLEAAEAMRQGRTTAEAFGAQVTAKGEAVFPVEMVHGLKIAEDTGAIKDPVTGKTVGAYQVLMQRFADDQMKAAAIISQICGAMMYPAGLIGVSLVIVTLMMYFVVPKLTEIYASISPDALLPLPTRIIVLISSFLVTLPGIATLFLVIGGIFLFVRWCGGQLYPQRR